MNSYTIENFHFPFDSSWNTLGMYEYRKLYDTPLADPPLRSQLYDNPLFTMPGVVNTPMPGYPDSDPGIDDGIPGPNDPGYPFAPLNPKYPPGMPGLPNFRPPNWPDPWPGTGDPTLPTGTTGFPYSNPINPSSPPSGGGSGSGQGINPKTRYDYEQMPIPGYALNWPIAGVPNVLPVPSRDPRVTYGMNSLIF